MPALPNVPKVIKTAIQGVFGDATWANILHWAYTGAGGSQPDMVTFATNVIDAFVTDILPHLHTGVTTDDVVATDLTSDTSPSATVINVANGGAVGTGMAASTATVLSHKINRRYRGGHPRTYLVGMEAGNMSNFQEWASAWVTTIGDAWASFVTDCESGVPSSLGTITPVNVSYRSGGVLRATPVVDVITATDVQRRVCNQRRRLGVLIVE